MPCFSSDGYPFNNGYDNVVLVINITGLVAAAARVLRRIAFVTCHSAGTRENECNYLDIWTKVGVDPKRTPDIWMTGECILGYTRSSLSW